MSEYTFRKYWPDLSLLRSGITLHIYSGESIPVSGTVDVCVKHCDQDITLPLLVVVVEGGRAQPPLLDGIGCAS